MDTKGTDTEHGNISKEMNEVNKTLYIPLYGKSKVSRQGIIINDPSAEKIWDAESFEVKGRSKSKWLAYNMAMRARVFDDWTDSILAVNPSALVLHIGCGLDSRCKRVRNGYKNWYDCDFPDVIEIRRKYYEESDNYHMTALDASKPEQVNTLPESDEAVVVFEGISMYLPAGQLNAFFGALEAKYPKLHVLIDVYTTFGVKASKYKNPVSDVGVTTLYGIDDISAVTDGLRLHFVREHSFTPSHLVEELKPSDKFFFKLLFTGKTYRKIYRLYELAS